MARIIGGLGTSHVPSIGVALDRGLADGPDWKPLFEGYAMPQQWMRDHRPDIALVIFNDHGNSFFLHRVPTFAVGVADSYKPVDEGGARAPSPISTAEREHPAEDVGQRHPGRHRLDDEDVDPDRRRDQPHFQRQHHQHSEPDQVDPQPADDRHEDRQGQHQHGEAFHGPRGPMPGRSVHSR